MVSVGSNLRLRRAEPRDAVWLACLRNELAPHFLSAEPATIKRTEALLQSSVTFVAIVNGCRVGSFAIYNGNGEVAEFGRFMVEPDWQASGIGRQLLISALETARSMGLKRLRLVTKPENGAAAHLYEDAGFKMVSVQMELTL